MGPGRAHLCGLAGSGGAVEGERRPAVHPRQPPSGGGIRSARLQLRHRARLHESAAHPRRRRHPGAFGGSHERAPDRRRRRSRGIQPGTDRELHRRRRAR